MTDPAEIRAEGRRLLAEYRRVTESPREYYERMAAGSRWAKWVQLHADVLLADPVFVGLTEAAAPTPLSDAERTVMEGVMKGDSTRITHTEALLALALHRLSAAPVDDREARWRRFHPSEVGAVPVSPSVDPEEKS